jgi:L-amino acid N-acyltransferase YncA
MTIEIRSADAGDLAAITTIYNALLATTTHEWTEELHTVEERAEWLRNQAARGHPALVAVEDGEVLGWAGYGDFRDSIRWPGYGLTVEHSIHVHRDHWRRGIGRMLLAALMDHARAAGKHVIVAGIDAANTQSIDFHARLGFAEVARMPEVGTKFGQWLDLVLMQRLVGEE